MSKKRVNTAALANELREGSVFFQPPSPTVQEVEKPKEEAVNSDDTMTPRNHDTVIPRYQDRLVELLRAAVKKFGKEAATHRFTPEEKQAIAEVVFTYGRQGVRTSENEISRIGVNFLIEDYKQNGENSILHKVLKVLNE